MDELFLILINGAVVLGIFVVVLINTRGMRKSRANTFLSVLLMAFIFSILHIRYAGTVIAHYAVQAYPVGDPTFLFIPPLLWFYTEELTGSRVRLTLLQVLHFVPFLLIIFCSLYFKTLRPDSLLLLFLSRHPRFPLVVFWSIGVIQFSGYLYWIQKKWDTYQSRIRQEVSNTENINIAWVRFFMGVFLGITIFLLIGLFVVIHLDYMGWVWKAIGMVFALSVFALGYKGILQKEIFFHDNLTDSPGMKTETANSLKPDPRLIESLTALMTSLKPFVDPELTLSSLAKIAGMSRSQLSQLINDGFGENFYDFVNRYRVDEVKRLMNEPSVQNYNLLGVAFEAGFKSKSTFNLVFKRFTGLTPTEYRKNNGQ